MLSEVKVFKDNPNFVSSLLYCILFPPHPVYSETWEYLATDIDSRTHFLE